MLKAIELDIQIFNHIFDIFNGGQGLHIDFIDNGGEGCASVSDSKMNVKFKRRRGAIAGGPQSNGEKEPLMQVDDDDEDTLHLLMRDPFDVISYY